MREMVSEADVQMAYRLILGREPENQEIVARHAGLYPDVEVMRSQFLRSAEFLQSLSVIANDLGLATRASTGIRDEPPARIDTDVSLEIEDRLTRHVEQTWTRLGETEPHWSVLSHEAFRSEQIRQNETEFFRSGAHDAAMFLRAVARCSIDPAMFAQQTCFELGCGVGRITLQLARLFDTVIAADISAAHLKIARQSLDREGRSNVELVNLRSVGMIQALPRVDAFISIIVLQHNPPPLMKRLLKNCLRRLRPNGLGYFQIPYYSEGYSFVAGDYVAQLDAGAGTNGIEMHVLPQPVIFDVVAQAGCQVLELREDDACGARGYSCSLLVRRI